MGKLLYPTFVVMLLAMGVPLTATPAQMEGKAVPTKIMVRVLSRDAKVIGSGVGGARVIIRDAHTGTVLAQGVQQGGTGSTELIMNKSRERGAVVYDTEGTAGFLATLMLEKPTVVEIIGEGPLDAPDATQRASKTLLLVPGQDLLGEGVLLEIHGYIVKLLAPEENATLAANQRAAVRATVNMA